MCKHKNTALVKEVVNFRDEITINHGEAETVPDPEPKAYKEYGYHTRRNLHCVLDIDCGGGKRQVF